MNLTRVMLFLSLSFLVSCFGGSLEDLAEKSLYASAYANKVPVPEPAPAGFTSHYSNLADMKVSFWSDDRNQDQNLPVVIYFHGNGLNIGGMHKYGFFDKMTMLGAHIVAVDYPGYGNSTGTPMEKTLVAGGVAVVDWAVQNYPNSKIILWGQSLGAGVAIQVGYQRKEVIEKMVLTQGWDRLENMIKAHYGSMGDKLSQEWKDKNKYDSVGTAQLITVPVLMHHGTKDKVVPFSLGESFFKGFAQGLAALISVEGKDHNDLLLDENLWLQIKEFIK